MLMCMNVCTLVSAWLVKDKPPPVQVAAGGGSMASHAPLTHVAKSQDHLGTSRSRMQQQIAGLNNKYYYYSPV